jgi:hypothetical protein
MAEALRIYAHLAPRFWGYARKHAAFLRNRCPSRSSPGKRTPFEIRYGKKPDLTNIKIFGCPCFALIKKQDRKMNQTTEKAMPAIFVGYDELERAYRVIPDGYRVPVTSRSVVFDELRASEKAKHIDAAQRLSKGYDVIQPQQMMEDPRENREVQTPTATDNQIEEAGSKSEVRELVRSAKSTQPEKKKLAKTIKARRSRRLNFAKLAEVVFDEGSDGDIETVQGSDDQHALLGEVEVQSVPKSITHAYQSQEAPHWREAVLDEMHSITTN